MLETAVVFNYLGKAIYWHMPSNRTSQKIPDSQKLWDFLWDNREHVAGIAHTHVLHSKNKLSYIDMVTFTAIESALGKRLHWLLISTDHIAEYYCKTGQQFIYTPNMIYNWLENSYQSVFLYTVFGWESAIWPKWIKKLVSLSYPPFVPNVKQWQYITDWLTTESKISLELIKELEVFLENHESFLTNKTMTFTSDKWHKYRAIPIPLPYLVVLNDILTVFGTTNPENGQQMVIIKH